MKFIHEYDEKGNHRLIIVRGEVTILGEWAAYTAPAVVTYQGGAYMICTAFFDGVLEGEKPYQIQPAYEVDRYGKRELVQTTVQQPGPVRPHYSQKP
jgi:hypothetical protein